MVRPPPGVGGVGCLGALMLQMKNPAAGPGRGGCGTYQGACRRLMPGFERDVRKILRAHGCTISRTAKGDHQLWYSPITGLKITVDMQIKSRHTANVIMKRAGINHKF